MYRCITNITITQQPSTQFPSRKTTLNFDFVNEFETSDSWRDLTNKGKIILPKNLYFRDQHNKLQPLKGTNINVGGFSSNAPLILRGDKVKIEAGYKYFNSAGAEITDTSIMHEGYVSKVHSKIPIEIEIEDNMWILKQTPVAAHTFSKTDTLENILSFLVTAANNAHGTNFKTRAVLADGATITHLNQLLMVGSETAAQVLQKLQKTYGFESYFRGNELRCGILIYIESEAKKENFFFQQNIISDELEYQRKEDITLSCVGRNTITEGTGEFCKDGSAKTKKKRLAVLVTIINNPKPGKLPYTFLQMKEGEYTPSNSEGEQLSFKGLTGNTIPELAESAYQQLKKMYYTGFKGNFTTFGIPFVRPGDNVFIKDPILPERDGLYKVKKVGYKGGIVGLRQEITLDYKINV